MEDMTIYLRGGQSITVRARESSWRRDLHSGGLRELNITYVDPDGHLLSWVRLEAVDAIESRPVRDPEVQEPVL